jgi:hypothetical protein
MSYVDQVTFLPRNAERGLLELRHATAEIAAEADAAIAERDALIEKLAGALSESIALADKNVPRTLEGSPSRTPECWAVYRQCVDAVAAYAQHKEPK